jgi:hypothetical protein
LREKCSLSYTRICKRQWDLLILNSNCWKFALQKLSKLSKSADEIHEKFDKNVK